VESILNRDQLDQEIKRSQYQLNIAKKSVNNRQNAYIVIMLLNAYVVLPFSWANRFKIRLS
jgi:hypothetical protein